MRESWILSYPLLSQEHTPSPSQEGTFNLLEQTPTAYGKEIIL